ncbi:PXPV repeat protein [Ramlibacter sp. WS9]|uniref:PXPV repeat protein n=1 Tax=Ramlibacter sp. WS9 TaxID=1882741 RepID=UPI001143B2D6|nr:PXPV repeat protein [Ramlibacter sp. WS9]ROZ69423.1 hypothetical protein EEB15_23205 [Ramlibacter sp. WS9]
MKSLSTAKFVAVAALAVAGFGAVTAAHARTDVVLQIGVPIYSQPVYSQPAPVYYEPAPVYVQPRSYYVQPAPVYNQYRYDNRGVRYINHDWERRHHGDWQARRYGPNGDLDRDGIANRNDRDRDGDGVRNHRDRDPNNGYRY